MTVLLIASVAAIAVVWLIGRLLRARGPVARLGDERADADGLRGQAEAVLAERLARGEIDDTTYRRLRAALWGVSLNAAPPAAAAASRDGTAEPEALASANVERGLARSPQANGAPPPAAVNPRDD